MRALLTVNKSSRFEIMKKKPPGHLIKSRGSRPELKDALRVMGYSLALTRELLC